MNIRKRQRRSLQSRAVAPEQQPKPKRKRRTLPKGMQMPRPEQIGFNPREETPDADQ